MLTTAEMIQLINHRRYKPHHLLTVYDTDVQGPHLSIRGTRENARCMGTSEYFDIKSRIPEAARETAHSFDRWVVWRLERMEAHEVLEWYQTHDGRPVFDPHDDQATSPRRVA